MERNQSRLWERLLPYLNTHPEFGGDKRPVAFGYDWRQSLDATAEQLGTRLDENAQNSRYVFFTHSMGGLVVRVALALGAVDPTKVAGIVHLGPPLLGAPSAFGSIYGRLPLPLLEEFIDILRWRPFSRKNTERFKRHVAQQLRTFPSVYQLLPLESRKYLTCDDNEYFNPLDLAKPGSDPNKWQEVAEAHRLIAQGRNIISEAGIELVIIY